jgi:hypothetical protein
MKDLHLLLDDRPGALALRLRQDVPGQLGLPCQRMANANVTIELQ